MALGGKRPGAGRKPKSSTIAKEMVKDYVASRITEVIKPLTDALIGKSLGDEKYKDVDVQSVKELFDRGFGKATQTQNVNLREVIPFDDVEDHSVQANQDAEEAD